MVVDDVGEVCQEVAKNGSHKVVGQIVGTFSFTEFQSCSMCIGKVSEINKIIRQCGKCRLKQKIKRCKKTCAPRVILESDRNLRSL